MLINVIDRIIVKRDKPIKVNYKVQLLPIGGSTLKPPDNDVYIENADNTDNKMGFLYPEFAKRYPPEIRSTLYQPSAIYGKKA